MTDYVTRVADGVLAELMADFPAVMLVGARGSGKTTTAKRQAKSIARLDIPEEAALFAADPDLGLSRLIEPALIDEWQYVPEVLAAIKRAIDNDSRPGRFIITGSSGSEHAPAVWPGTGRFVRLDFRGLLVRERLQRTAGDSILERLNRDGSSAFLSDSASDANLADYIDLALVGGFPEAAMRPSKNSRHRWHKTYVEQLTSRDVAPLSGHRDPARLLRYFEAICTSTAGIVADRTLYQAAGVARDSGLAYDTLLRYLSVVDEVPAWTSNRLKRLQKMPKRYVTDGGLLVGALGLDVDMVLASPDLTGRVLDTFVYTQLAGEIAMSDAHARLFHLRQEGGRHEVDIIIELGGGRIFGIEVKAHSSPNIDSAGHLRWLRDELGDTFVGGAVLHAGKHSYQLDDKIVAAPVALLWAE